MIKTMFLFFLMIHILCDFYFQTEEMAARKQADVKWVLLHSVLYAGVSAIIFRVFLPGFNRRGILYFSLSHGVIDLLKFFVCRTFRRDEEGGRRLKAFLIDQALHISVIVLLVYSIRKTDIPALFSPAVLSVMKVFEVSGSAALVWTVKLLLLHKPANILIASMLEAYRPPSAGAKIGGRQTGRLIGTLERMIIAVFL